MTAGDTQVEGVPELIDARCDGIGRADLIFVFGTREHEPARLAGDAYQAGLAPIVVVTGGAARQVDGLNEAQSHRQLLLHRGVPDSAILVEDRSTHTGENVDFALELLGARGLFPTTVVAVVKRHHRRALITLAAAPLRSRPCTSWTTSRTSSPAGSRRSSTTCSVCRMEAPIFSAGH